MSGSAFPKRWAHLLLPAMALAAGAFLQVANPPLVEDLRLKVFDLFEQRLPRTYQQAPVAVVDLDDETLARAGQWPWPRTQVAELVNRLQKNGAAAIAFDILFAESDRTSPRQVLSLWPATSLLDPVRTAIGQLPDHDWLFAQAISRAPVVTGFSLTQQPNRHTPVVHAGIATAGVDPKRFVPKFRGAIPNLPELEQAAKGNGHLNILPERDGIVRRVPLFLNLNDTLVPALVAEAVRLSRGVSSYTLKSSESGVVAVRIGSYEIPTDAQGRLWLHDTGPQKARSIPAWQIFSDHFESARVSGKIIFVGSSAAGLKDLRASPLHPAAAGVELHAQLAEQIVRGNFLVRPDWAPGAEFLFLLLLGIALILLLPRVGPLWCAILGFVSIAAVWAGSWRAYIHKGWLLDPLFPSLVTVGLYLVGSLLHFLKAETQRREIRQAFSRYVSPALVERLAQHPEQLRLGGESRVMTLLFADIRDFTTIAEELDAQSLTQFMNRFLTPMTQVILRHGGTIDKYIGDCIMAFWNAPVEDPEHARHACEAALAMRQTLATWNKGGTFKPIAIGTGINTGHCCVGNVGSDQRFDYSALGDAVNLASRLEGQSKAYGMNIVMGPETYEQVSNLAALELDLMTVKGKTQPVRIYGLLGDEALRSNAAFEALKNRHDAMLAAYRAQRWNQARQLLEECRAAPVPGVTLEVLYEMYRRRIDSYETQPPAADWNGVFVATSK